METAAGAGGEKGMKAGEGVRRKCGSCAILQSHVEPLSQRVPATYPLMAARSALLLCTLGVAALSRAGAAQSMRV